MAHGDNHGKPLTADELARRQKGASDLDHQDRMNRLRDQYGNGDLAGKPAHPQTT